MRIGVSNQRKYWYSSTEETKVPVFWVSFALYFGTVTVWSRCNFTSNSVVSRLQLCLVAVGERRGSLPM